MFVIFYQDYINQFEKSSHHGKKIKIKKKLTHTPPSPTRGRLIVWVNRMTTCSGCEQKQHVIGCGELVLIQHQLSVPSSQHIPSLAPMYPDLSKSEGEGCSSGIKYNTIFPLTFNLSIHILNYGSSSLSHFPFQSLTYYMPQVDIVKLLKHFLACWSS